MTTIFIREDTTLPERRPYDLYETSSDKVLDGLNVVTEDSWRDQVPLVPDARILDPGAASGAWGAACRARWPKAWLAGVEVREVRPPDAYDQWVVGEFDARAITDPAPGTWDLVVGNPPYREAEHFVRSSLAYLRPGGKLLFLLRLAFLESKGRGLGLFREHPPKRVEVCMSRPSFTGNGKTNATSYAFFLWQKGYQGETALGWR